MATFYRVVKANPPTERDFYSYRELGLPLRRDTPELRRSWEGVSVRSTLDSARDLVRQFPRLGRFIAILELLEGGPVRWEQTFGDLTHYDLHGDPRDMLAAVVAVVSV
jgi:hypothetical protein